LRRATECAPCQAALAALPIFPAKRPSFLFMPGLRAQKPLELPGRLAGPVNVQ
jgi:hypothetical protein